MQNGIRVEKRRIFNQVLETFKSLKGYTVKYKLVHSKDYGVPQNRPRILIIGIKSKLIKDNSTSRCS